MATNFNQTFNGGNSSNTLNPSQLLIGRVSRVVMGPYLSNGKIDPDYTSHKDIGKITYVIINSYQYNDILADVNRVAYPLYSHITEYPVEQEYVLLLPGPGVGLNDRAGDTDYYYIGPINLYGHPHYNSFPDLGLYSAYVNQQQVNYQQSQQGNSNKQSARSMEFPFNTGFTSRKDSKKLIPFTGDVLIEGRYGNSIRFGATAPDFSKFNKWSAVGNVGDPITIIRNGQGQQSNKLGYVPTIEDLDVDNSSIYLTAGQSIEIADLASFPLTSWNVTLQARRETVVTLTTPPTSNDNFSAQAQDTVTNTTPNVQQRAGNTFTPQIQSSNVAQVLRYTVVGDYLDLEGTNTVSLRAIDSSGVIVASTTNSATKLRDAYTAALTALKEKTQGATLVVPSLDKLQKL